MRWLIRKVLLWAAPELKTVIARVEPEYDPAELDRLRREGL